MGAEPMIAGAIILAIGFLGGRFLPGRRRGPKPPKPVEPICGCKHNRSYHKDGTGKCNAWDSWNGLRCGCQHYTGPEPLPEYFAPEIGG